MLRKKAIHEAKISANFHKKATHTLASLFNKARRDNSKPSWVLSEDWAKLLVHWKYDPGFNQMSDIGKMQDHLLRVVLYTQVGLKVKDV